MIISLLQRNAHHLCFMRMLWCWIKCARYVQFVHISASSWTNLSAPCVSLVFWVWVCVCVCLCNSNVPETPFMLAHIVLCINILRCVWTGFGRFYLFANENTLHWEVSTRDLNMCNCSKHISYNEFRILWNSVPFKSSSTWTATLNMLAFRMCLYIYVCITKWVQKVSLSNGIFHLNILALEWEKDLISNRFT